jgi:hypothetical protein
MSTGQDLVDVAKQAHDIYKTAKQLRKDLENEEEVSKIEIDKLKKLNTNMLNLMQNLPDHVDIVDSRSFIKANIETIDARIKQQKIPVNFSELAKLKAQRFSLENLDLKLALLGHLDVKSLIDQKANGEFDKLLDEVKDAQKEIGNKMKTAGYTKLAIKSAILAIDLGVLVASAMA